MVIWYDSLNMLICFGGKIVQWFFSAAGKPGDEILPKGAVDLTGVVG